MRWGLLFGLALAGIAAGGSASVSLASEPSQTETPSEGRLEIVAIGIEPEHPGPETLCRLRVTLRNSGRQAASRFRFVVRVADQTLEAYENQLFLQPVAAGTQRQLELLNFWSSEAGRPYPKVPFDVEVRLEAASWVRIESKSDSEERIPLGPVTGLPISNQYRIDR